MLVRGIFGLVVALQQCKFGFTARRSAGLHGRRRARESSPKANTLSPRPQKALETLPFPRLFALLVTQLLRGCYAICYAKLCNTLAFSYRSWSRWVYYIRQTRLIVKCQNKKVSICIEQYSPFIIRLKHHYNGQLRVGWFELSNH